MKSVLFIGGPRDGTRCDVTDDMPRDFYVAEIPPIRTTDFPSIGDVPPTQSFTTHRYVLAQLADPTGKYFVYMFEDATNVMQQLIEGYRKP